MNFGIRLGTPKDQKGLICNEWEDRWRIHGLALLTIVTCDGIWLPFSIFEVSSRHFRMNDALFGSWKLSQEARLWWRWQISFIPNDVSQAKSSTRISKRSRLDESSREEPDWAWRSATMRFGILKQLFETSVCLFSLAKDPCGWQLGLS